MGGIEEVTGGEELVLGIVGDALGTCTDFATGSAMISLLKGDGNQMAGQERSLTGGRSCNRLKIWVAVSRCAQ